MKSSEVREKFLEFFGQREHKRLPGSSLIPRDDPTLMFTNAGMNQFKNIFLGLEKASFSRATTCQKCCRVTGKHNDFEMVGKTPRHHTFFEMLGNFSFFNYFKKEAIEFAYDLVVKEYGIPLERLVFTVFKDDDEAYDIWNKHIGIPAKRIYRFDEKENFWAMGETGPCGPCSEIHYDFGPEYARDFPNADPSSGTNRFTELWNLVFMQYNRDDDGRMEPLSAPCVDTGAGLERISAVLQGKDSNYHSDLFLPLIGHLADWCNVEYIPDVPEGVALRVMADHTRAATFLIGDGLLPSNEGRGYVLRRIIRRGIRFAKKLEMKDPFLYEATGFVIGMMKEQYPELTQSRDFVARVMLAEEERFNSTISYGMNYFQEIASSDRVIKAGVLSGKDVFKLYDTFGLPLDFTKDLAEEKSLKIDEAGFDAEMEKQRERARRAWKGTGAEKVDELYLKLSQKYKTEFRGYDELETPDCKVLAIIKNGEEVEALSEGEEGEIILDKTPFYGESGGQVGDTGWFNSINLILDVKDTKKPLPTLTVHRVRVKQGEIRTGDRVRAKVNESLRKATMANHTATHLLQAALRNELGMHIKQAGSLVSPEKLRFDFTHFAPLTRREIQRIEEFINQKISLHLNVRSETLPFDKAIAAGAIALFGEKYGDSVRMITIEGRPPLTGNGWVSRELCGGTHISNTGEIEAFYIDSEGSIAAGVRRIEAWTGARAKTAIQEKEEYKREVEREYDVSNIEQNQYENELLMCAQILRCPPDQVLKKFRDVKEKLSYVENKRESLFKELNKPSVPFQKDTITQGITLVPKTMLYLRLIKKYEKDIETLKLRKAETIGSIDDNEGIKKIGGVEVFIKQLDHLDAGGLRDFSDRLKNRLKSCIIVIGAAKGDKALLLTGVTDDLTGRIDAVTLIKAISGAIGGGGGGRPDLAQAGGRKPENIDKALEDAESFIRKTLSR